MSTVGWVLKATVCHPSACRPAKIPVLRLFLVNFSIIPPGLITTVFVGEDHSKQYSHFSMRFPKISD
jgi:hypothetical protein